MSDCRPNDEDAAGAGIRVTLDSRSQVADRSREAGDPACLACLVCPDCGAVTTEGHAANCPQPGVISRDPGLA